jgi:hypothetical protein
MPSTVVEWEVTPPSRPGCGADVQAVTDNAVVRSAPATGARPHLLVGSVLPIGHPLGDWSGVGDCPCTHTVQQGGGEVFALLGGHPELADLRFARVRDYDDDYGTSLVESLGAYLAAGMNVRDAAAVLTVHPNTLRYRVDRAQQLGSRGPVVDGAAARVTALNPVVSRSCSRGVARPVGVWW